MDHQCHLPAEALGGGRGVKQEGGRIKDEMKAAPAIAKRG
jgi:hypothetical protein